MLLLKQKPSCLQSLTRQRVKSLPAILSETSLPDFSNDNDLSELILFVQKKRLFDIPVELRFKILWI